MSKRRKGFPSESKVKRGVRIVHGNKELTKKPIRCRVGWAFVVDAVAASICLAGLKCPK